MNRQLDLWSNSAVIHACGHVKQMVPYIFQYMASLHACIAYSLNHLIVQLLVWCTRVLIMATFWIHAMHVKIVQSLYSYLGLTIVNLELHPIYQFLYLLFTCVWFKQLKWRKCCFCFLTNYFNVHSTFVCPTEIIAFSDRIAEFQALDTEVIGASTDSHFSHLAWINTPRKVSRCRCTNGPTFAIIYKVHLENL